MIIRDRDRCNTDWCDAKREIAELKAQVALLRQVLTDYGSHSTSDESTCEICKALEATK